MTWALYTKCIIDKWFLQKQIQRNFQKVRQRQAKGLYCIQMYRVLFLTVPPDFQYQNEKRWAANQGFCSMKFSMYKRSLLVEQCFSF